jgi:diguanylate cyclase (GGDEF)-like protein/putative nucleotidyltransferase with HDIG domain
MSTIPGNVQLESDDSIRLQRQKLGLPLTAILYGAGVMVVALAVAAPAILRLNGETRGWATFAILAAGASVAQLYVVRTARDTAFHTTVVFVIPAIFLLPPELVALLALVKHIPEWLKERYAWYMQSFNICNYTIVNMAMWAAVHMIQRSDQLIPSKSLRWALAGLACCTIYAVLNQIVLAPMMSLARNRHVRQVLSFENLSTDWVLATLGFTLTVFWQVNPWLIPFAFAPMILIHRSLAVPQLQVEARVDPKTGLFNARHFAQVLHEELGRAQRFDRPMSLIMADLDLLRDINNTYGHLAGDAVLSGIAEVFRGQLRHYDVPSRFGGEEFAILLPETPPDQAMEIAERIRRAVAASDYEVETSSEPIRATISMGVAGFPRDGSDANELVHQADLAVYRAKLQGRNRVLDASNEPLLAQPDKRGPRLVSLPDDTREPVKQLPPAPVDMPEVERRTASHPHAPAGPRFFSVPRRLAILVGVIGVAGTTMGILAAIFGASTDIIGLIAVIALVAVGQALSLEVEQTGTISVSAVGALAGAAIIGPRAALALAITMSAIEWSTRRSVFHQLVFNVGILSLASLAAAAVFSIRFDGPIGEVVFIGASLAAGLVYFLVNTGLLAFAVSVEGRENPWHVWKERFSWLLLHYVVYGFIAGVIAEAYQPIGFWALAVFALPLFLMRKTQEAYLKHTQRSAQKLRQAAETIQTQNVSLEQANRLLKERSTAAMESLSATVDARDAYTAGHSRRVQQLALAIGRELKLSKEELELLGHAALFHDIGKLAIPDAILLKPSSLTDEEWALMARHAEEGASIINRLGFLNDAVPAIRHHHERFDGAGYPDGLYGEDIPLGARIIHVADAFDSMLTTRVYRPARPAHEALAELRNMASTQFCPRCVGALEAIVAADIDGGKAAEPAGAAVAVAS